MTADSTAIWSAARRDLALFFSHVDGAEVRLQNKAFLGISGGQTADFNMALFDEDPDSVTVFEEFVARVTAIGLPALAMVSSVAGRRLGPIATARGLVDAGAAPMMVVSAARTGTARAGFTITRVTDSEGMSTLADLAASAFDLDRTWVGKTFATPSQLQAPGLDSFLAYRDNTPMSGVTTTRSGPTVGIWLMSTPPDRQRQGAGRAVLTAAMDHHQSRGAKTLIATPSGKPLYDGLGFTTVDELSTWLVGTPSPHSAH